MGNNVSLREKKQSVMNTSENVATESARKPRLFRWALWWGLGIVVICLAILIVYALTNPSVFEGADGPMTVYIYSMVYHYGIWAMVIYMGILGPIIEEISFRLWGNGKMWTGIVSVILMALWGLTVGWWLSLLALCVGIAILVIFKEDRTKRLFALMLLSSILFAVAHMNNYDGNMLMTIVGVVHKIGFGLVTSYLVINHNILWSMGLHVINNMLLMLPCGLTLAQMNDTVLNIDNERFSLEVRPVLVHNDSISRDNSFFADADSNYYFGNTAGFAGQAWVYEAWQNGIDPNGDSVNVVTDNAFPNCCFKLVYKTQPYDHHGLITAMEHAGLIKIDTIYDSTTNKKELNIKSTYDPLSEDE
jgi:membrane protease YdiL (CAAX protease family)